MPVNRLFPPEGLRPPAACTRTELEEALAAGTILEGVVQRCDARPHPAPVSGRNPGPDPPTGGHRPLGSAVQIEILLLFQGLESKLALL